MMPTSNDSQQISIEQLKFAALARLHTGAPESLPGLHQIRERVFLDLAQNGVALYACPDHPLAAQDIRVVPQEVREAGWVGIHEPLHALAERYPFHLRIVCAVSLNGSQQTSAGDLPYYSSYFTHHSDG